MTRPKWPASDALVRRKRHGGVRSKRAVAPTEKRPRGRPTVWTDEVEAKIFEAHRLGCSDRTAAEASGISAESLALRKHQDPDFLQRCQAARAIGTVVLARELHTTDNPARVKASTHLLACREPQNFAATQRVEHTGSIAVALAKALAADPGESDDFGGDL